jgi:hypothetical protein
MGVPPTMGLLMDLPSMYGVLCDRNHHLADVHEEVVAGQGVRRVCHAHKAGHADAEGCILIQRLSSSRQPGGGEYMNMIRGGDKGPGYQASWCIMSVAVESREQG